MPNIRFRLLLIVCFFLLSRCEKKQDYFIIEGNVHDPNMDINVSGAEVMWLSKNSENGVVDEIARSVTALNGDFTIKTALKTVYTQSLRFTKPLYFQTTIDIQQDQLKVNQTYKVEVDMYPISVLKLMVRKKETGKDQGISIESQSHKRYGTNCEELNFLCNDACADTIIIHHTIGGKHLLLKWTLSENLSITTFSDSIFCQAFDTTSYTVEF